MSGTKFTRLKGGYLTRLTLAIPARTEQQIVELMRRRGESGQEIIEDAINALFQEEFEDVE